MFSIRNLIPPGKQESTKRESVCFLWRTWRKKTEWRN